jgi:predicted secreted Zn-dependent protease
MTERVVRYAVHGRSIGDLKHEMSRIGPIDDGGHQPAHTWGMFAWRWQYAQSEGSCAVRSPEVELEIVQTFPERSGARGSPVVNREWTRWLAAVGEHEAAHHLINVETARELMTSLPTVPAQPTCAELDRAANELGQAALTRMRAKHAELDRTTAHGTKTGALLHDGGSGQRP